MNAEHNFHRKTVKLEKLTTNLRDSFKALTDEHSALQKKFKASPNGSENTAESIYRMAIKNAAMTSHINAALPKIANIAESFTKELQAVETSYIKNKERTIKNWNPNMRPLETAHKTLSEKRVEVMAINYALDMN